MHCKCSSQPEGYASYGGQASWPVGGVTGLTCGTMNVPLICDYGSGISKVGFAGTEAPLAVFPTILGKLRHDMGGTSGDWKVEGAAVFLPASSPKGSLYPPSTRSALQLRQNSRAEPRFRPCGASSALLLCKPEFPNLLVGMEEEDWFIGDEVQKNRGKLNLQYPISRAAITNWDNMEKIWHHSFYKVLHVAPEQHPLMVTEPPLNTMANKEKVSQILFETFGVPALYLANQGVLSLYASGQTCGMTLESGEGMTYFVPIIDGCPLPQSTFQMDIAGQDLTLYFLHLLSESGHSLVSTADREFVRDLKEKCCYVALDFEKEKVEASSPSYAQKCQLPDGQEIDLGRERFFCPEVLFQTDLIGRHHLGVHTKAFQCVSSCDPALWKILFGHIVLSGGTGTCSGLRLRLQREISTLVSPKINVKDMWVTSKEYKDIGSSVIGCRVLPFTDVVAKPAPMPGLTDDTLPQAPAESSRRAELSRQFPRVQADQGRGGDGMLVPSIFSGGPTTSCKGSDDDDDSDAGGGGDDDGATTVILSPI
ncbi:actin, alpha skeletal muscle 2 [Camelus ferus]|nr:actin, alpha skeletal muscle 2 [Camelus ferus]